MYSPQNTNVASPFANLSLQAQSMLYQCMYGDYDLSGDFSALLSLSKDQDQLPAGLNNLPVHQHQVAPMSSCSFSHLMPSDDYSPPVYTATDNPRRLRSGNRIPRPANPFILFRSHIVKYLKLVEHDHRLISRAVAYCWRLLPEQGKDIWRLRAEEAKILHRIANPDYRYTPVSRKKDVVRRNVKRNGEVEIHRCKEVANFIFAGKVGTELDRAVKSLDASLGKDRSVARKPKTRKATGELPPSRDETSVSLNPLLPPVDSQEFYATQQYAPQPIYSWDFTPRDTASLWGHSFPKVATQEEQSYELRHVYQPQNVADWATPSTFINQSRSSGNCCGNHFDASLSPAAEPALEGSPEHLGSDPSYIAQDSMNQLMFNTFGWFPTQERSKEQSVELGY